MQKKKRIQKLPIKFNKYFFSCLDNICLHKAQIKKLFVKIQQNKPMNGSKSDHEPCPIFFIFTTRFLHIFTFKFNLKLFVPGKINTSKIKEKIVVGRGTAGNCEKISAGH